MKTIIKKLTPHFILLFYHWLLAWLGAFLYGHPSRQMIIIGVTGTKGKSTLVNLIAGVLEGAGFSLGLTSTINFKIGQKEWKNDTKQTMPGRFKLQKLLAQMVKAGCQYAVIETSSEGIAQYRHQGIDYDVAVFTNLSPEHIESHGSYEKYRQAKTKLFKGLSKSFRKEIKDQIIQKVLVVNHDDQEAKHFLSFSADKKYTFGLARSPESLKSDYQILANDIKSDQSGISFFTERIQFNLKLLGQFNVYNALAAITVGLSQKVELAVMKEALKKVTAMPGRMEEIENDKGFRVFVDYAHEPASLEEVYKTLKSFKPKKIISVLGSQGGGRDKTKRPILGKLAGQYTDRVIITNEDPYDEDPQQIINEVADGALRVAHYPVEKILDRRQAIKKALDLAQPGDVVIITGKGSETVMAVEGGKKISWDDRKVCRELLKG